jgi:hypothetical protein
MLEQETSVEHEDSRPGDEQRLAQPDPADQLGGNPEGEDQQADELE